MGREGHGGVHSAPVTVAFVSSSPTASRARARQPRPARSGACQHPDLGCVGPLSLQRSPLSLSEQGRAGSAVCVTASLGTSPQGCLTTLRGSQQRLLSPLQLLGTATGHRWLEAAGHRWETVVSPGERSPPALGRSWGARRPSFPAACPRSEVLRGQKPLCPFMAWSVQGLDGFLWPPHKRALRCGCGCQWFVREVAVGTVGSGTAGAHAVAWSHWGDTPGALSHPLPPLTAGAHSWVSVAQHF